jgi:hypothetical protein
MALSARIPDGPDLTGLCRHKLEGILDMHGVKTGSRGDFPGFLEKLHGDRYFAMDFWALVESLEGMGDRISDEQIRRSVAECVCGWVPNGDPAMDGINEEFGARGLGKGAQDELRAGEAPLDPGLRIVECGADAMAADPEGEANVAEAGGVRRELPVVELGEGEAIGAVGRIDRILSRLELNDHELKLLLESIESRISRLEPHVEELASQVVKSRHPEAGESGRVKKERGTGMELPKMEPARAWVGRRRADFSSRATATGALASRGMKSADLRFAKMRRGVAAAAAEFDGAVGRALPSRPALRRMRRAAMLRMRRGQMALRDLASRGLVKGRAIGVRAIAVAGSFKRKLWLEMAPEMLWLRRRRGMLNNAAKVLGVGMCLWLVVWLWGRPRPEFVRAKRVSASTNAPVPVTPQADVPPREDSSAGAPVGASAKAESGSASAAANGTVAGAADEAATGTVDRAANESGESGGGLQRVASQVSADKPRDYTAPPWTKWYDEDGKESKAPSAVTAAPSGADSAGGAESASAKKGGGR